MVVLLEWMKHRRAIRWFEARQVEEEARQQILEEGLYAPGAGGWQSVIFAVCQDREINRKPGKIQRANFRPRMASGDNYVSGERPGIADDPKPANAFYDGVHGDYHVRPGDRSFAAGDCAVAAENMMPAADALGTGSCYRKGDGHPAAKPRKDGRILKF